MLSIHVVYHDDPIRLQSTSCVGVSLVRVDPRDDTISRYDKSGYCTLPSFAILNHIVVGSIRSSGASNVSIPLLVSDDTRSMKQRCPVPEVMVCSDIHLRGCLVLAELMTDDRLNTSDGPVLV